MTDKELLKLKTTCNKIYDSDEYKSRRKEQSRFLQFYTGKYWPEPKNDDDKKESEIYANLIFSTVMTIAPMLTDNKPIWSIRARYPFLQPMANNLKAAGDALWSMEEMDAKIFQSCLDSLIMKNGIFQVSFDPKASVGGEVKIEVIDPRTYFQAPGFEDNWDAPLCGTKVARSLWWIRSNYPDKGEDVKPEGAQKADKWETLDRAVNGREDHEYLGESADVFTVWMRDETMVELKTEDEGGKKTKVKKFPNGRMVVFTKEVVLEDRAYPYNHGKPPWVFLYDYMVPHSVYGMGEVDQIEGLVLEYNLFLRRYAKHCRINSNKNWIIDAGGTIDPEEFKKKFAEGDNCWTMNAGAQEPKQIQVQQFDPSTLQFINGMPTIIQDVSGVTDVSKGMASKKQRQSAHEISALLETSYTRTRQRVRNLEASIKRLYTLVVELMQQFYTERRTVSYKNGNGDTEWYDVSNTAEFAKEVAKPTGPEPDTSPGSEKPPLRPGIAPGPEEEDEALSKEQWKDYKELIEYIGEDDSIYIPFEIDIETNSTLPMDQQSLANLGLQLAQMGHIDTLSLLEMVHIPNAERIVKRLKEQAQAKAAPPPGANPMMPQGGPNG